MTFIVVPHGGRDLNTRSFEVSYRRLRVVGVVLAVGFVVWIVSVAAGLHLSSRAARVSMLEREVAQLRAENVRVAELAEALRRIEGQYEQVREMLGADGRPDAGGIWLPPSGEGARRTETGAAMLPTAWPLTTQAYVTREHLATVPGEHPGIDIAVAEGAYVRAAGAGVVTEAGEDDIYGNFVRIRHADGYETVYGHASELFVAPSDTVSRHEVIALSGNTGRSTAPHLHFEVWKDGEPVDPRSQVEQPPETTP